MNSDLTEKFLQAMNQHTELSEVFRNLPYYEKYPKYAEVFFYTSAESLLNEKMMNIADILIK
jgi:hypothetical protein